MMRIYKLALELVASVCRLADEEVKRRDPNLASQMKRAVVSVPLNMQEGLYGRGGTRVVRLHDSMGSAKETMACLDVCVAARYLKQPQIDADLVRIDQIVGGLYCLAHKRRA